MIQHTLLVFSVTILIGVSICVFMCTRQDTQQKPQHAQDASYIDMQQFETSEVSENPENVETSQAFTTPAQFESAQSNIFDPSVQETEIRMWEDGYSTQGVSQVPATLV